MAENYSKFDIDTAEVVPLRSVLARTSMRSSIGGWVLNSWPMQPEMPMAAMDLGNSEVCTPPKRAKALIKEADNASAEARWSSAPAGC